MYCFLLKGVAFGVFFVWFRYTSYEELTIVAGLFFFLLLFILFLVVCIRSVFKHLVGAKVVRNCYLCDTNICSLSKNKIHFSSQMQVVLSASARYV
jgi:hypothetical protein